MQQTDEIKIYLPIYVKICWYCNDKQIYYAYVYPLILNGIKLYGTPFETDLKHVQIAQNKLLNLV